MYSTSMKTKFFALALISAATLAVAQHRSMTVEQAIAIGIDNSKTLHSSASKAEGADAHVSEIDATRFPSLKFTGGYTRLSPVEPFTFSLPGSPIVDTLSPAVLNNWNFQLSFQQPLFTGFRLLNSSRLASHSAEAAHFDYDKDRRDFIFNVRTAYWNVYKTIEFKKVVDQTIDQASAHLKDVQNLLSQGMATNNDALKVQVQLSNAKFQQLDAANNARMASMALDNLIGLPLDTEIDVASVASSQPRTFGETKLLIQKAIEVRPDVKAMEERVKASDDVVNIANGGWWPQVFLVANYTYAKPNSRIFPTVDEFKGTWSAGVSAAWDLGGLGTVGFQKTQAQASLAQSVDALGLIKDGITLEVHQNALMLDKAKERIAVAQEGVTQAEENLRVTNDRFKAGLILNSEVLDAEVLLQQSKMNFTQSVVDFELAQAGLAKAIGE